MGELSRVLSEMKKQENADKIEIATIINLSPFTIQIDDQQYDAVNFSIFAPMPMKIKEKRPIDIVTDPRPLPIVGHSRYKEYDLEEIFDHEKTLPFEVGDIISVVDKGATFIVLSVLVDMKNGVKI